MSSQIKWVLSGLVLLEMATPILTLVLILALRLYVLTTHSVPGFVQTLNRNFFPGSVNFDSSEVTGGILYVSLFLVFPIAKFVMALKFWQISQDKEPAGRIKWILKTILLTTIGIFLIFPLQGHGIPETGICILFIILHSIISFATIFYIIAQLSICKSLNTAMMIRSFLEAPLLTTKV